MSICQSTNSYSFQLSPSDTNIYAHFCDVKDIKSVEKMNSIIKKFHQLNEFYNIYSQIHHTITLITMSSSKQERVGLIYKQFSEEISVIFTISSMHNNKHTLYPIEINNGVIKPLLKSGNIS